MPTIKSARNGLEIDVPADASGIIRRFQTPGDNELIFAKHQGKLPRARKSDTETLRVESLADKNVKPSDLA